MIAVILSAQCTDERVNIVTAGLFPEYNTAEKMLSLGLDGSKKRFGPVALSQQGQEYSGQLRHPLRGLWRRSTADLEELVKLPGVAARRPMSWSVSCSIFRPLPSDTHVFRVSNRLQLAKGKTPLEVEKGLQKAIPKEWWSRPIIGSIWHGRRFVRPESLVRRMLPL